MVCYVVPLGCALIGSLIFKIKQGSGLGFWLLLLLYGAAIFGVVDHLMYGELFLIGENPLFDLLVGMVISLATIAAWGLILVVAKHLPGFWARVAPAR